MTLINFRDMSGIRNREGKQVKPNRLLRSGELVNLDDHDINHLIQKHNLQRVVDLRSINEKLERPDDKIKGVNQINLEVMKDAKTNGVGLDDLEQIGSAEYVDDHMFNVYHDLILNSSAQKCFGKFLSVLISNDKGATLFHCFAGKDRTGIAAALVLSLLDVEEKLIIEDYLKTNEARKSANRIILDDYRAKGSNEKSLEALEVALKVKREYLERAFELIRDNYGNIYIYTEKALNFGKTEVEKLKYMYLS